jgi:hypothetical protein
LRSLTGNAGRDGSGPLPRLPPERTVPSGAAGPLRRALPTLRRIPPAGPRLAMTESTTGRSVLSAVTATF